MRPILLSIALLSGCPGKERDSRIDSPAPLETGESAVVDSVESGAPETGTRETGTQETGLETGDTGPLRPWTCGVDGIPSDGAPVGWRSLGEAEARFEYLGGYFAAGDQDGDGCADAAWGSSGGEDSPGRSRVFMGPLLGEMDEDDDWSAYLEGDEGDGAMYPASGDVDGDGLADWVIGGYGIDGDLGGAYVVHGPAYGTVDLWTEADAILVGQGDTQTPYCEVSDLDADGFGDVVVLAAGYIVDGEYPGGAYVQRGPVTGTQSLSEADAVIIGDWDSGLRVGWSVSSGGDLDGDGLPDLAMGQPASLDGLGVVYLFRPPLDGTISVLDADALFYGEAWSYAGCDVSSGGDTDGDGYGDLLVGAWDYRDMQGRAYLLHGPVSGTHSLGEADAIVWADGMSARVGYSVSLEQDMDADGRADVAVGSPGADGARNKGAVFLFYEPFSGTVNGFDEAEAVLYSETDEDWPSTGYRMASAGDVNGDGYGDLHIGTLPDYLVFGGPR